MAKLITEQEIRETFEEFDVDNSGTSALTQGKIGDALAAATEFNTGILSVKYGNAENVEVNANSMDLTDTVTFGLNADSGILKTGDWGAGTINLHGSANMSIDGDLTSGTSTVINADHNEQTGEITHTGTLTLNGNQVFNGDITAKQAGSVGGQMVKKMIESYENSLKTNG